MSDQNTTPELFDQPGDASQEDLLQNEDELLRGLLELGNAQNDESSYRLIQIKRNGELKLEFRVRPLSEEENQQCWKNATKYAPGRGYGQPKTAIDTDRSLYRSWVIYSATVDEDRKKVWDNQRALSALNLLAGVDMVEKVLRAGEKDQVINVIEDASGFNTPLNDLVKN
jgi:hypothetical protein